MAHTHTVRLRRAGQLPGSRPDTPPDTDQTRNLAVRAQRGTLTPAEAAHLIAGVDRLIAERDEAITGQARLLAAHAPAEDWSWKAFGCQHSGAHYRPCAVCRSCWPCPTVQAAIDAPKVTE